MNETDYIVSTGDFGHGRTCGSFQNLGEVSCESSQHARVNLVDRPRSL